MTLERDDTRRPYERLFHEHRTAELRRRMESSLCKRSCLAVLMGRDPWQL